MNTIEEKAKVFAGKAMIECRQSDVPFDLTQSAALGMHVRDAYLAGAAEALAGQWHEIDEECKNIPHKDSVCLCRYRDEGYTVAIFDGVDEWTDPSNGETYISAMWNVIDGDYVIGDEITHWLLIPEPPKDESV